MSYHPRGYGEAFAPVFDQHLAREDTEECLALLREEAGPLSADILELGVGTGRLALPLAMEGHRVAGIEVSAEMAALLAAKPGSERIRVLMGDFSEIEPLGAYDLVYAVDRVLGRLHPLERLLSCFRSVHRHLRPAGRFVCDGFLPPRDQLHQTTVHLERALPRGGRLTWDFRHDPQEQLLSGTATVIGADGRSYRDPLTCVRYNWPEQLDQVAREAGLILVRRAGDWRGGPLTETSRFYFSVYGRT